MSYSFLDLAYDVLKKADKPMVYQEIWQHAKEMELTLRIDSTGKTPWRSLGSRLYVDIRDNEQSKFVGIGKTPVRFFLRERAGELPPDVANQMEMEESKSIGKKSSYQESTLHPMLAYFVYANPIFNRGRSIYTKTIAHQNSKKSGYNEWIHPDMVGFYLPFKEWHSNVIELNRLSDNNALRLFSFEIKKSLTKGTYRESFFQAVSNSSWAHEGYLVAADILQEDEFLAELERLASSFGIGIIHLDMEDVDNSKILYPARVKRELDWQTINKLCEQNKDFEQFLQNVKIDFEAKRVHRTEYDKVVQDVAELHRGKTS
ncbi:COG2958 family protein [Geoalkalibacter halelectricus]|uniref:COG2958 family protein n=1 Tax=Geoalkalibacter halelectricus TaxID=2847045 RepID=UPI003D2281F6